MGSFEPFCGHFESMPHCGEIAQVPNLWAKFKLTHCPLNRLSRNWPDICSHDRLPAISLSIMALSQRLDLRQSQALVMTPQLQQAIKLLQLSNLELSAFIEGELEQNPLLERDDAPAESAAAIEASAQIAEPPPIEGDEVQLLRETSGDEGDGKLDLAGDPVAWQSRTTQPAVGDNLPGLDQTLSRPATLREHLLAQLSVDIAEPVDRFIGAHLIDMVDEAGYLQGELADVAERLDCDVARVEATLRLMQRFDPPGIMARS